MVLKGGFRKIPSMLWIIGVVISLLWTTGAKVCLAGNPDLQDGICSYTDDPISSYDSLSSLGSLDINIGYIIFMVKSRAYSGRSKALSATEIASGDYTGNINSVVLRPGSVVYGDIYVIDTSQAPKTQVIWGNTITSSNLGNNVVVDESTTWNDIIRIVGSGNLNP